MHRLLYAISIMFLWVSIDCQRPVCAEAVEVSQLTNPFSTNPQQIEPIGQLGYGTIQTLTWLDTGLYIRTSAGIWRYEDPTNTRLNSLPEPLQNRYSGPVIAESFTGNTTMFATEYNRGMVEVTNAGGGESRRWEAHSYQIKSAAINPVNSLLAVARWLLHPLELPSEDAFDINIWNVTTGQERFRLRGHTAMIPALSFSADGKTLASASYDGTVRVWDMTNGDQILELQGGEPITFGTNDTLIFTRPDQIILYDLDNQQIIQSLPHQERIVALAVQGESLAAGDDEGQISVYDLRTTRTLARWKAHFGSITSIQWAPNGLFLASASQDELKIWGATSANLIVDLPGFTLPIHDAAWMDNTTLVSSESSYLSGRIRLWNPFSRAAIWESDSEYGSDQVVVAPDGLLLISNRNGVTMVNPAVSAARTTFYESREIQAIALGQSALAVASYNWIDILNLTTQDQPLHLEGHRENINALAFSTDGTLLASGSGIMPVDIIPPENDYSIRLRDPSSGNEVAVLLGADSPVLSLAFSPDNHWLASGHDDGTIEIWDVSSRTLHLSWTQSDAVEALAFHPDSTVLASGSRDNRISLWAVDTDQSLGTLQGNMGAITSLAFDPTGQYLASSSLDGTVRLWGVQSQSAS